MNAESGSWYAKPELTRARTGSGGGARLCSDSLLAAKSPGPGKDGRAPAEDAQDVFYLISGTRGGRLYLSPIPGTHYTAHPSAATAGRY